MPSKYINKLQGQRVVVLGGTSGIGFAVGEAALENGATVIISGSKQDKVDRKLKELHDSHQDAEGRILGKTCDLSDLQNQEENIVALLDFASDGNTKKLDHIVNTTGDGLHNPPFSELSVEVIHNALPVRIIAPLLLAKHARTYLNPAATSSIAFTGGSGTYKPAPSWTLMPIIGGMLETLVRTLAVDVAPIRVNGVAPGPVITEMWGGGQKLPKAKAKEISGQIGEKLLTGQAGRAEDLAEAYVYFMKDCNVTGQMVVSDGGSLLKS